MPKHSHEYTAAGGGAPMDIFYQHGVVRFSYQPGLPYSNFTMETGGDQSHNTLPPYLVLSTAQIKY
jgi:hypothetical protein